MNIYGPFPLHETSITTMITRIQPGVGLLCDAQGCVETVTRSDHDVAEVLLQWVGRASLFYFIYTTSGTQAERLQKYLAGKIGVPVAGKEAEQAASSCAAQPRPC